MFLCPNNQLLTMTFGTENELSTKAPYTKNFSFHSLTALSNIVTFINKPVISVYIGTLIQDSEGLTFLTKI